MHGVALAEKIIYSLDLDRIYVKKTYGRDWQFFRETAVKLFQSHLNSDEEAELRAVAQGVGKKFPGKCDFIDILAHNGLFDSASYHSWLANKAKPANPLALHCSAFAAVGSFTRNGEIIMGHNTWFPYIFAESGFNTIIHIEPERGRDFIMQTRPGFIFSGSDWYLNSAGLAVCETTISGFNRFKPDGVPLFLRARRAIQNASSLKEWSSIMRSRGNGGYASTWLVADAGSNKLLKLELGAGAYKMESTSDGYYGSSNLALDSQVRRETSFDYSDRSSSGVARMKRWNEALPKAKQQLDVRMGKRLLADHVDSSSGKVNPSRNSICGHVENDPRGLPEWGCGPYYPQGAFDAKIVTSTLLKKFSFYAKWGKSCGSDFNAQYFLKRHPEYSWQAPYLRSIRSRSWIKVNRAS
jgi:hypothetical protein